MQLVLTRSVGSVVLLSLLSTPATAQVTATYNFTSDTSPSTTGSGVAVGNFAFNPAASATVTGGTFNATSSTGAFISGTGGTYYYTTLSGASGNFVQIDGLSFDIAPLAGGGTSPTNFQIDVIEGFTTTTLAANQTIGASGTTYSNPAVNYTATSNAPLELRIYTYGGGGTVTGNNVLLDNVTLNLSPAPVPEPVFALAAAAAGLGLVRRRAKRLMNG